MQEVTQLNVVFQQPPKLTTPQPPPYDRVSFNEFSFIAHAETTPASIPPKNLITKSKTTVIVSKDDVVRPKSHNVLSTEVLLPNEEYNYVHNHTLAQPSPKTERRPGAPDKSQWRARALREQPEIEHLMQQIANGFVKHFGGDAGGGKEIPRDIMFQLILQHLHHYEFHRTADNLAAESGVNPPNIRIDDSRLQTLVYKALSTTERFYDLVMGDKIDKEAADKQLCETLMELGLIVREEDDIWVELMAPGKPKIEFENEGKDVAAGSMNRLIERLTHETTFDKNFVKSFLFAHKLFTTSEIVFQKLLQRYRVPPESSAYAQRANIQLRVSNVLKQWLQEHFEDFSHKMIEKLLDFINSTMLGAGYQKLASQLEELLRSKINGISFQRPSYVILRDNKIKLPIKLQELDDEAVIRLAQHFTLIEFGIYSSVKTSELLGVYWEEDKKKHLAPNIKELINRFNMVAFWVTSMILKTPRIEDRAKVVTTLIKVAEYLRKMNNFQTMNGFLSGLNSSAIKKLRATHMFVPPESLQTLDNLTDLMKKETFLEVLSHTRPPVIPFIGYFQSMLVGIELMSEKVGDDMVNFSRYSRHYKCISNMLQGQLNPYKFKLVPRLFHYCSLLTERESETEIDKLAASLEREENRIIDVNQPTK